ncbi:MAG: nucleoside triphosphate pyrophosphohydrolase [Nitrospirae bacterium]|nr:nucleoside triphosphate pyrophosphohydrolase [Nitrospirota bacterium]
MWGRSSRYAWWACSSCGTENVPRPRADDPWRRLRRVSRRLRSRKGCPWDRVQTCSSLRPYVIEEAYEVVEAIEGRQPAPLKEELGDLLYQVFFLSEIAREKGWFSVEDVAAGLAAKLVERHPHVFGRKRLRRADQVLRQWAHRKARRLTGNASIMDSVPRAMPALLRARRVSEKAARVGFDWGRVKGVLDKVEEELIELRREIRKAKRRRMEAELGDLLFTLVNLARFLRVDPESALRGTVGRFERRFRWMEVRARGEGKDLALLRSEEWERLWREAKSST